MTGCLKIVLGLTILVQAVEGHPRIMLNALRVRPRLMLNSLRVKQEFNDSLRAPSDVEHSDFQQVASGMKTELKGTEAMVGRLSGKQATEARRVHSLLQAAARMAHHGAVAGAVQQRLNARFALLFDDLGNKFQEEAEVVGPAEAAAEERRALNAFASGMERVAGIDGNILAFTKRAASRHGSGTRNKVSVESEQLLSQALRRESRIVSEELRNAKLARKEASRLEGVLQKQGSGALSAKQAKMFEGTRHILSKMSEAKKRIAGLLRGSKDAALARRLSKAIDGAERAEATIAYMESHQLVQAREAIQKLQQLPAGAHKQKHAQSPANPAMHTSPRAKLQPMMRHVQDMLRQQVLLARRESGLATKSDSLAAELQQRAKALAEGLRDSGDSTDQDVAAEIEKRLEIAQSMLRQMALIHKKLGQEAVHKVATLRRRERMLAQGAHQRR